MDSNTIERLSGMAGEFLDSKSYAKDANFLAYARAFAEENRINLLLMFSVMRNPKHPTPGREVLNSEFNSGTSLSALSGNANPSEFISGMKINGAVNYLLSEIEKFGDDYTENDLKRKARVNLRKKGKQKGVLSGAHHRDHLFASMVIEKCNIMNFKEEWSNFPGKGIINSASSITYSLFLHTTSERRKEDEAKLLRDSRSLLKPVIESEESAHLFVQGCVDYLSSAVLHIENAIMCIKCIESALVSRRRFIEVYTLAKEGVAIEDRNVETDSPYGIESTERFSNARFVNRELLEIETMLTKIESFL